MLADVAPGCLRQVTGNRFILLVQRLRQASAPGSGGDPSLCSILERLHWWSHVRQAPSGADLAASLDATGFRAIPCVQYVPLFTCGVNWVPSS